MKSLLSESSTPDPRQHPRALDQKAKKRQLAEELLAIENGMTGGPALSERLLSAEADGLLGKANAKELEELRRKVAARDDGIRRAAIIRASLKRIDQDIAAAEADARAELAPKAFEAYAEATRSLVRCLLDARSAAIRLHGLREELEEKFFVGAQTGGRVHLPGYSAAPMLALAQVWHRLLAAEFCELKGYLRDCHDLGLVSESDLGGVYTPKPAVPPLMGTIASKRVRASIGKLARELVEEIDAPHLRPDNGGRVLRVEPGKVNVWSPIGPLRPMDLRDGDRVRYTVSRNGRGEESLDSIHLLVERAQIGPPRG